MSDKMDFSRSALERGRTILIQRNRINRIRGDRKMMNSIHIITVQSIQREHTRIETNTKKIIRERTGSYRRMIELKIMLLF